MSEPSWPSVSVIVPAYRQEAFVSNALDSIAAQDYPGELEVLVVDDGSPDDGAQRAREHALAPRVIVQENQGVSGARNTGMREARGDYFAFLDADDVWVPGKLTAQIGALEALRRPGLSFTRYRRVSEHAEQKAAEHPSATLVASHRRLAFQNFIGTSTVVMHRACHERAGFFPTREVLQRGGQDYALWLRVASLFPLVYVPDVYMLYTVHESNRVGTDPVKHFVGGINALSDFVEWAPERFAPMTHRTLAGVWAARTAKLTRDLIVRRSEYPEGSFKKALKAFVATRP